MKNLRIIAMTGFIACCMLLLGSQINTFAQGRSGKSKGNSRVGVTRSTDAIQRGIDRVTSNRRMRSRTYNQDWVYSQNQTNNKNKRYKVRSNNGVRDHGRGIGRGKGQGKGRGYYKKVRSRRDY